MILDKCFLVAFLVICCGRLSADDSDHQKFHERLQFGTASVLLTDGKFDEFSKLISQDPTIAKRTNPARSTLLHEVAVVGHRDSAELLLESGASMECLSIRRLSPFHMAAIHNKVAILDLFIEKGADINSWGDVDQAKLRENTHYGSDTGSPLDRAAQVGAAESVAYLLERGAKLDSAPEGLRFTALHHAMTGCWRDRKREVESTNRTRKIFRSPIPDPGALPSDGNSAVIKMLVDHGADLRAKDFQGNEPLHIAAWALDAEAIEFVLTEYGSKVDVNAQGQVGLTPLKIAMLSLRQRDPQMQGKQEQTIATLKKYGARVNR